MQSLVRCLAMKKLVNIAIIGMGHWGNHLLANLLALDFFNVKYICCRKKEDVKVNTNKSIIFDDNIILDDSSIDGVIISTSPESHFQLARKFLKKGLKVFVEKPLTLSHNECVELLNISKQYPSSGLMVGNKFVYSTAINKLKDFIDDNNIKINSISSRWLKGAGIQNVGIFFDIAYHHIYLADYLLGCDFINLKKYVLNKKEDIILSGLVILDYKDAVCSIEVSYNNHFDFYDHNFRIETNKGVFFISEKDRKLSVFFDNKNQNSLTFGYQEEKETCVTGELTAFYKWLTDGGVIFGPEHDCRIINYLEK